MEEEEQVNTNLRQRNCFSPWFLSRRGHSWQGAQDVWAEQEMFLP